MRAESVRAATIRKIILSHPGIREVIAATNREEDILLVPESLSHLGPASLKP
jgi:hypothetical protein